MGSLKPLKAISWCAIIGKMLSSCSSFSCFDSLAFSLPPLLEESCTLLGIFYLFLDFRDWCFKIFQTKQCINWIIQGCLYRFLVHKIYWLHTSFEIYWWYMSCHICAGALLRGNHFQQSIAAELFLASARLSSRNERVTKDNSLGGNS